MLSIKHLEQLCSLSTVLQDSFSGDRNRTSPWLQQLLSQSPVCGCMWLQAHTCVWKGKSAPNPLSKPVGGKDYRRIGPHMFNFLTDLTWDLLHQTQDSGVPILIDPNHFKPIECCTPERRFKLHLENVSSNTECSVLFGEIVFPFWTTMSKYKVRQITCGRTGCSVKGS